MPKTTVNEPPWDIRNAYFKWLYDQVFVARGISYVIVCEKMHSVPFNDRIPNDDNRARGGLELRNEFMSTLPSIELGDYTRMQGMGRATVFEVLIALARKADFQAEIGPDNWFRIFLENLGLSKFTDRIARTGNSQEIERIIVRFNNRRYSGSGEGGIFPLRHPKSDQRKVELWFQMSAYILENEMILRIGRKSRGGRTYGFLSGQGEGNETRCGGLCRFHCRPLE